MARKELCDHDAFEPLMVFSRFAGWPDGEINEAQIADYCNFHAIKCSLDDAALLISQYDEKANGKLAFNEFCSMMLSATNATLRAMAISRDSSGRVPKTRFLDQTLEHALTLVFLRELDYQRNVEEIKTELRKRPDFDISRIFEIIDTGRPAKRIDRYEIRDFVEENLKWLEEDDLDAIIRRWDTDGDELLTLAEFKDAVKNAKPVRTITPLEEKINQPPRFVSILSSPWKSSTIKVVRESSPCINPPPGHPSPYHTHSPPKAPIIERVSYQNNSPTRVAQPVKIMHRSSHGGYVEEHKYSSPWNQYASRGRSCSPLRGYEEHELVESFKELICLERELEFAKQALAMRPDFTLHDAFKMFDFERYGRISIEDIREAFHIHEVFITLEEAKLIMSRYDTDMDGFLRFDEFIEMFLPKDISTWDALADRSAFYPNGYYATPGLPDPVTCGDFIHVLALNVKVENHAEGIRQKHHSRPLFNRLDAFEALNKFGDWFVTKEDFSRLLANHRFYASEGELNTLVDRFDKNKDGRVTFGEFVDEITPHSPQRFH